MICFAFLRRKDSKPRQSVHRPMNYFIYLFFLWFFSQAGWRVPLKIPKDCWRKFKPNSKSGDSASASKHKAEDELLTNPTKRFRYQLKYCKELELLRHLLLSVC